jgi:hypothetical protein
MEKGDEKGVCSNEWGSGEWGSGEWSYCLIYLLWSEPVLSADI